jgi:hypothetical protein
LIRNRLATCCDPISPITRSLTSDTGNPGDCSHRSWLMN